MATVADMPYQLGRRPSFEDPRTLKLASYTTPTLEPAPSSVDWWRQVSRWPMYANDRVGCCVAVSCAHLTQGWTRYAGQEIQIPEADVLTAYSTVSGYDPVTGANDDGCRSLDMLNHWRQNGIGGRQITAYMRVNERDREEVHLATHLFGGLLIGIEMPLSAGLQIRRHQPWRVATGPSAVAGSWGGHAVRLAGYDRAGLTCITWGATQRMSSAFWTRYVVEAWAVVGPDWLRASDGVSPTGLRMDALLADLQRITAN